MSRRPSGQNVTVARRFDSLLVALSFTNYELGDVAIHWIGLANFERALADPVFRRAIANTLLYVAIVLPGGVALGLLVAILVHGRTRSRGFYEVVYFLPVTATLVAMAAVWQFILHPRLGPVNAMLTSLGFAEQGFLSSPSLLIPTLAFIGLWNIVGFNMVLFLAGLSAIPRDLYDAAVVDGATGAIDRFLTVTGRCWHRRPCSSPSRPPSLPSRCSTRSPC